MSEFDEFAKAERAGWSDQERASGYVNLFAAAADEAIEPLLIAGKTMPGSRTLDLCCGQGNVSEALVCLGCEVIGLDFSPSMLDRARARVPSVRFHEGDAQSLPFSDGEFDAVVSNFGICHVPDQARALSEAARVLRPGGHFAMTVWCGPDRSPCFELVYRAVEEHGSPDVIVPPGPDFHQFADPDIAGNLLHEAGFHDVRHDLVDCVWNLRRPDNLIRIYEQGTVRAAMLLASQPPSNLDAIRRAVTSEVAEGFAHEGAWRVPVPAALNSAVK